MNIVDISVVGIESPPWLDSLETFIKKLMHRLDLNGFELSVMLCNDGEIKELNKKYRNKNAPTDVLSFPQIDRSIESSGANIKLLGDIVISLETVKKNALENNVSYEEEIKRVIIHGLLHLLGLDHDKSNFKSNESPMILKQEKILKEMLEDKLF